MKRSSADSSLEKTKSKLYDILVQEKLLDTPVEVWTKPLTPEEAIGHPQRRDYPIIEGKERVIEARIFNAKGHAFTDSPGDYRGTLASLLDLSLDTNQNRAFFTAALNATLRYLKLTERTVHCKDEDPEQCSQEIAAFLLEKYGRVRVGLIGLNPAIAEALIKTFGTDRVLIADLDRRQIGKVKFGVEVWNGRDKNSDLIEKSDVVICTGTTLVNGSFDTILDEIKRKNKAYLIYGVTCAGVCSLLDLPRVCFYGRDD